MTTAPPMASAMNQSWWSTLGSDLFNLPGCPLPITLFMSAESSRASALRPIRIALHFRRDPEFTLALE
jgi:hypothetical protein